MIGKRAASAQLDRLTRVAALALDVPMVAVTAVGQDRIYYLATVGITAREAPRQSSLCLRVIEGGRLLHVSGVGEEAQLVAQVEQLTALGAHMYAGSPLRWPSGKLLGTLCVMDTSPRVLSEKSCELLGNIAALVEESFASEEQQRQAELEGLAEEHLRALLQAVPDLVLRLTGEGVVIDYHCANNSFPFPPPSSFLG